MTGDTATLAIGGCAGGGVATATSGVAGVLKLNSEVADSQPARPSPAPAMRMASATFGYQRRAAAAFMVVTVTSPLLQIVSLTTGSRRTNPAAGDSTAGIPADSLIADTVGVQFQTGENCVEASRAQL